MANEKKWRTVVVFAVALVLATIGFASVSWNTQTSSFRLQSHASIDFETNNNKHKKR